MASTSAILAPGNRVVMISGAGRGIGRAIATRLRADGYRISLGIRNPSHALIGRNDEDVLIHPFEASNPQSAQSWVNATATKFGGIDVLVNNAAVLHNVEFGGTDEAMLNEMWQVNVMAPLRLTRLVLPYLRKCGSGRIVNLASLAGLRFKGVGAAFGYSMTKFALVSLSHATRNFGWDDGVRVTALCPGPTDTAMTLSKQQRETMTDPDTVAHIVSHVLSLPNTASVAFLPINSGLEATV